MIRYYQCAGLVFASDVPLRSLPEVSAESAADVVISVGDLSKPSALREAQNLVRLDLCPGLEADSSGFYLDWKQHGLFRVENGKHIFYNSDAGNSPFFEHFLVNEVMAGIFFQRGYFLLHGSAALLPDGTAAAFVGEPGAGKSTALGFFVKHGCKVLTDEIVLIHFEEGLPYLRPFIPVLRLWNSAARHLGYTETQGKRKYEIPVDYIDRSVPLNAAFSLHADSYFHIQSGLSHREHLDLFGNFPLPRDLLTPEEQVKRFRQAAEIVRKCRIFQVVRSDHSFEDMDRWVNHFLA